MNKERLTRTSVFLGCDQLEQLRAFSNESGVPIAVMVRRGVALYLSDLPVTSVGGIRPRAGPSEPAAKETSMRAAVVSPSI